MAWEYKYVELDLGDISTIADIEGYLNDWGDENWELCSCSEVDVYKFPRLIFKRKRVVNRKKGVKK